MFYSLKFDIALHGEDPEVLISVISPPSLVEYSLDHRQGPYNAGLDALEM